MGLAVAIPAALLGVHHGLGHEGDLAFFHEWYLALREGPAFYRDGPGVNYPILGALLVGGPSRLVDLGLGRALGPDAFRLVHKLTLVAAEAGLILVAARLARTLGAPRPRWLALALYALPSTWAGGAWFGQTDVVGTVALLAAADGLLRFERSGDGRALALGVAALHAALLLKQLTWFALPPLALLLLVGLRRHGSPRRWALVALSPLAWLAPDPFLVLPDDRVSHLAHVVARSAGDHGTLLVANGASVWALVPDRTIDARAPWLGPLSPFFVGAALWALAQLAWLARARAPEDLVRGAGIASLAMALLLTGVHERYLAHAIPLLFLTTRGPTRAVVAALGVASGLFVLASVHGALSPVGRHEPVLALELVALAALLVRGGPRGRALAEGMPAATR